MKSITRLHTFFLLIVILITPCMASTELPSEPSDLKILHVFENTLANIADQSKPAVVGVTVYTRKYDGNGTTCAATGCFWPSFFTKTAIS